jgi:hypothetical protein
LWFVTIPSVSIVIVASGFPEDPVDPVPGILNPLCELATDVTMAFKMLVVNTTLVSKTMNPVLPTSLPLQESKLYGPSQRVSK